MPDLVAHRFDEKEEVQFPWGKIRWLMESAIEQGSLQTFGIVEINAGQSNSLHSHPNCEEILYVLSGKCEHVVGDEKVTLGRGDLIRIPIGVPHKASAIGNEPLRAVISFSSGDREVIDYENSGG